MVLHIELMQTSLYRSNIFLQFLNHVLNWMFQCQDVTSSKPGWPREMIKSNQSPKSATLLKKDSMVDYLFSHKAVIQISLLMSFLFM